MTALIMTADKFGLTSLADWFRNVNAKRKHRALVNRTIKELSALSDRELNDMGLARGDIWSVAHGDESYKDRGVNSNLRGWV